MSNAVPASRAPFANVANNGAAGALSGQEGAGAAVGAAMMTSAAEKAAATAVTGVGSDTQFLSKHLSSFMDASSYDLTIPLELKILSYLIVLFLFLLFLILVLWDRYGNEIGALYTPNHFRPSANDAVHAGWYIVHVL